MTGSKELGEVSTKSDEWEWYLRLAAFELLWKHRERPRNLEEMRRIQSKEPADVCLALLLRFGEGDYGRSASLLPGDREEPGE